MILEYGSNNSGGGWWLTDEHWLALEEAGWTVKWKRDQPDSWKDPDGRFLGALATEASIETENPKAEISRWESIVGMSADDEGCNCCGPPHNFSYTDDEGKYHFRDVEYGPIGTSWV